MAQDTPGTDHEINFAKIYNDVEKYPSNADVAKALGKSKKTVRNYSARLRNKLEAGQAVPELIKRSVQQDIASSSPERPQVTPREHAAVRAVSLRDEVSGMLGKTDYPVINPEALVVESHITSRYDRITGGRLEVEGVPRTWLTDTLMVAGIRDPRGRKFLFSSAQNDTEVDLPFWQNLKAYQEYLGADLIIGPLTYETNWWDENNPSSRSYDDRLVPHLCFGQLEIGDNFVFCGEMNTLPTAPKPIQDLTTYSRGRWAVFPHPRLQLISVPSTDPNAQAHQIMTTGSVTGPKVIPRKAGIKSIFHHIIGATLVEFDEDGDLFCRQISATKDGSFYDLDRHVADGVITHGHRARAITFADIHRAKLSNTNSLTTFGVNPKTGARIDDSVLGYLKPDVALFHDLHDHESRNHHNEDDISHNHEMAYRGRESVMGEVQKSVDFLLSLDAPHTQLTVIDSNHDLALERYVREGRHRMDGMNYRDGLRMESAYADYREELADALDDETETPKFSMLEWAMRFLAGKTLDAAVWVYDGDPLLIDGVNVGSHGFRGSNGAQGTVAGFARLGQKMTIGDKHSPAILDGVYGAGVMQLRHGYNKGPSGWACSHVVQYADGKRTTITLQNGKWRAI